MPIPAKKEMQARLSAKAYVYNSLREWIIDGTLKPGEKIFDKDIAEYFSVSRTPVREAMQQLADQQLICITPGKESKVAEIDKDTTKKSYILLADLHVRALRFAWDTLTEEDIKKLEEIDAKHRSFASSGRLKDSHEMDKAFHDVILERADCEYIRKFSDTLLSHVQRIEYIFYTGASSANNSENSHENIIKAIKYKNLEAACEALSKNWLRTMDTVDKLEDLE